MLKILIALNLQFFRYQLPPTNQIQVHTAPSPKPTPRSDDRRD